MSTAGVFEMMDLRMENQNYAAKAEKTARAAAATSSAEEKHAKDSLYALVDAANAYFGANKSPADLQKLVNSLYYSCRAQVNKDRGGSPLNRRSLLHEDVSDAAQTMCVLGFEKMKKFDPTRGANFATFLGTVFVNDCNTKYGERERDARFHAESLYAPVSGDDDAYVLADLIGYYDRSSAIENLEDAEKAVIQFAFDYAAKHFSPLEYKVFLMRMMEGKSNREIAREMSCGTKCVENGMDRALRRLRKDARDELDAMLWKNYGFHSWDDLNQNITELRSADELYLAEAA